MPQKRIMASNNKNMYNPKDVERSLSMHACHHPLFCCTDISILFGTSIPTSFNILNVSLLLLYKP